MLIAHLPCNLLGKCRQKLDIVHIEVRGNMSDHAGNLVSDVWSQTYCFNSSKII